MRTNIDIPDALLAEAMKAAGVSTKRDAVVIGLETIIKSKARRDLRALRGKVNWIGDLDAMRLD